MTTTFEKSSGTDKVLARRNDADHGEMLYYADGYVTVRFMYYLQKTDPPMPSSLRMRKSQATVCIRM